MAMNVESGAKKQNKHSLTVCKRTQQPEFSGVLDRSAKGGSYAWRMDADNATFDDMADWEGFIKRRSAAPLPVYGISRQQREAKLTKCVCVSEKPGGKHRSLRMGLPGTQDLGFGSLSLGIRISIPKTSGAWDGRRGQERSELTSDVERVRAQDLAVDLRRHA